MRRLIVIYSSDNHLSITEKIKKALLDMGVTEYPSTEKNVIIEVIEEQE